MSLHSWSQHTQWILQALANPDWDLLGGLAFDFDS